MKHKEEMTHHPATADALPEDWTQQKRSSTLQLLFKCTRLLNERALARAQDSQTPTDSPIIRPSHTQLFPHIPAQPPGVRITTLADKLDISKQAVSQLVDDLERLGLVSKIPDPDDRRARNIIFTSLGIQQLQRGLAVLRSLEDELADELGKARMRALHDALLAVEALLDPPTDEDS